MTAALTVDAIDALEPDACEIALAPLFEGAPAFLGRLCAARPFRTDAGLFAAARAIAHAMPDADQVELVDAHPRLGAPAASVSALSFVEQGYDRESAERADAGANAEEEAARLRLGAELEALNGAYEARFGFRCCIFVAGRTRAEVVPDIRAALDADRATELDRALDAVVDIAADRWAKRAGSRPGGLG